MVLVKSSATDYATTWADIGWPGPYGGAGYATWNINVNGSAIALTTARTLTIGSTGKTFNGSSNVSWSLAEIGAQPTLVSATNIKTVNGSSLLGSGDLTVGGSSWIRKTANYTAVASDKIIADTTSGTFTITLPASPTTGMSVELIDGNDWSSTNLTVARNGSTIEGLSEDLVINIKGASVTLVYDSSTWEVFATFPTFSSIIDETTNATRYVTFASSTNGALNNAYVSSSKLTFNPSTGELSATNFNSLSDISYKENIQSLTSVSSLFDKINPVEFTWKDTGLKSYGVIAQEIEKIIPEMVSNIGDKKMVSYNQFIPFLISAVKELQEEIRQLKGL
jgi:hypothetical protein